MADFDDFGPRPSGSSDSFGKQVALVALALGVVVLAGYFIFLGGAEPEPASSPATTDSAAISPTPEIAPTPEATPTPEPTPAGPPTHVQAGELHAVAFRVRGSLANSIAASLPPELAESASMLARRLGHALSWRLNPRRDIRKNDVGKIVFNPDARTERVPLYGFFYHSRRLGQDLFYVYFPEGGDKAAPFFDEKGFHIAETLDDPPLAPDDFAKATVDYRGTQGLFFAVRRQTKIIMPRPGHVLRVNWDTANLGRSVEVKYLGSPHIAWFVYLDDVSDQAAPGALLGSGSVVATSGQGGSPPRTGFLYRAFEQKDDGKPQPISPLDVHKKTRRQVPAADRVKFVAVAAKIQKLFARIEPPQTAKD